MGFTDNLKRSLGFEETESSDNENKEDGSSITEIFHGLSDNIKSGVSNLQNSLQNNSQSSESTQDPVENYNPNPMPQQSAPFYDDFDYVITPEQSYYEIVLIRPKSIDDVNYVVDQVLEEKNPVILDLSFLEKESPANFRLAGDKINKMRERYGAQALLLARSEQKNLIIISPKKVKLVKKNWSRYFYLLKNFVYLINTYATITVAITISVFKILFKTMLWPIFESTPFVASPLITNGNVKAAKLG